MDTDMHLKQCCRRLSSVDMVLHAFFGDCVLEIVFFSQINLHHCSSGETVRGERAKSVANYCLSVKTVRDKHVNSLARPAVQKMESVHLHVFV